MSTVPRVEENNALLHKSETSVATTDLGKLCAIHTVKCLCMASRIFQNHFRRVLKFSWSVSYIKEHYTLVMVIKFIVFHVCKPG